LLQLNFNLNTQSRSLQLYLYFKTWWAVCTRFKYFFTITFYSMITYDSNFIKPSYRF